MLLGKKLDKTTPIPLYFQLKELIMSEIKNGSYPKDSMIPTEKELSDMFGISRTTVRQGHYRNGTGRLALSCKE